MLLSRPPLGWFYAAPGKRHLQRPVDFRAAASSESDRCILMLRDHEARWEWSLIDVIQADHRIGTELPSTESEKVQRRIETHGGTFTHYLDGVNLRPLRRTHDRHTALVQRGDRDTLSAFQLNQLHSDAFRAEMCR